MGKTGNLKTTLKNILRSNFPFYPFLIGLYAMLFLMSVNLGQVTFMVTLRALLATVIVSAAIFLICFALTRNLHNGAFVSGWLLAIIFLYGQLFGLVDGKSIAGNIIGRHRYFLPLAAISSVGVIFIGLRSRKNFSNLTVILNSVSVFLVIMAGIPILSYEIRYGGNPEQANPGSGAGLVSADADAPDVYYIILDGYARSDVLASDFNYDNSYFTDGLRELGFYFPECPFSNYITTTPSLSSSLNMDYLENLGISEKATVDAFDPSLTHLVSNSKVLQIFEGMDYKIAAFRGYLPALDLHNADYYFNFQEEEQHVNLIWMHNFERLAMRASILRPLVEAYEADPDSLDGLPDWFLKFADMQPDVYTVTDRQLQLEMKYTFEMLPTIPQLPGLKFVYAHVYAAHIPYVFDQAGNYTPEALHYDDEGYIPALEYTSHQMLGIIRTILDTSERKPVIILQADHGMWSTSGVTHNKILSAFYFPDGDYSRIYPTITPVNIFRIVLDQFFHQDYELLPDRLLIKDVSTDGEESIRHIPATCDTQ